MTGQACRGISPAAEHKSREGTTQGQGAADGQARRAATVLRACTAPSSTLCLAGPKHQEASNFLASERLRSGSPVVIRCHALPDR